MSDSKRPKRLSKLARDFNVGISTIVEFMQKKGIEISSNPNTKIAAKHIDILVKEYSADKSVKKESEKLSLRKSSKKETISIKKDKEVKPATKTKKQEDVLLIKDLGSKTKTAKPPVAKEPQVEDKKSKFKIVGKIDLDKKEAVLDTPPKKKVPEKVTKKPTKSEPTPAKEKPTNVVKKQPEKAPAKKKEIVSTEKIVNDKTITETNDKKTAIKETEKKHKKADNKHSKKPVKKVEKKVVTKKATPPTKDTPKTQDNKEKDKKNKENVKIVGKIDLNTINEKTRPPKKSKRAKDKADYDRKRKKTHHDKPQSPKVSVKNPVNKTTVKNPTEKPVKEEPKIEIFKTAVQKLSGPTVVGKIDLPEKKKKPVASSSDKKNRNKKKKRKRITKNTKDGQNTANKANKPNTNTNTNTSNRGPGSNKPRTSDNKRTDNKRRFDKTKRVRKPIKKEVSEEDVQKQVKETLARLTSKSKTKTSKYRRAKRDLVSKKQQEEMQKLELEKNILKVTEFVSVSELAAMMDLVATDVIDACMSLGLLVGINQRLDAETISLVADEFKYEVEFVSVELQEAIKDDEEEVDETKLKSRAPIVTVMGHVDHGKTSLLDHIRKTNVIAGEAGGITQHIGAYNVSLSGGRNITFLDTPGHEAFTAMRARGAQVTDVAIIVVASDDNVMPQTIEAINHAKAAGVPIVFAINKIDKQGANPDKIKEKLANMNFLVEDWGGKYQSQDISAKHGKFVDELLEKVLLEAEMLELKANPERRASGTVVESTLDKGRGYVMTILVKNGSLNIGDIVLAGSHTGRVKAMYNERNQRIKSVGPGEPALILGLSGAPQAGDNFNVMESEREAREIANKREQLQREQSMHTRKHITLDEIGRRIAIGNFQELNIVLKGDVDGSIEALSDSLIKLSTKGIQVNIIHKAVGQISESDIMLATASNAIVLGFQVRPSLGARKLAETEGIDIRLYSIIYDALAEVKDAMEGMLSPEIKEKVVATLEIIETFKISKIGTVAGCIVRDGKISRKSKVRIIRDGIVVYTGDLGSLKRFKDDVKEVTRGFECGLNIDRFNDIKVSDVIEAYEEVEIRQTL